MALLYTGIHETEGQLERHGFLDYNGQSYLNTGRIKRKGERKIRTKKNELCTLYRAIVNDSAILYSTDETIVKGNEPLEHWPYHQNQRLVRNTALDEYYLCSLFELRDPCISKDEEARLFLQLPRQRADESTSLLKMVIA
jgi:hypothetical protein